MEATFGEGKEQHGLWRCRSIGLLRFAVQGFLTVMVMNLKLVVLLIGEHRYGRITAPIMA